MDSVKELNTLGGNNKFKFHSFAQRIDSINVDVIHHFSHATQISPPEGGSFFHEGLLEWRELNCTTDFVEFFRDVSQLAQSFNLLVFNRDIIAERFLKHLTKENSLAYDAMLNLVTLFAKDLRSEFYPYFSRFFNALVPLLRRKLDVKLIEGVFHCLGFLYKYLRKELVRDFTQNFLLLSPLLAEQHRHIRWFAGPGLAFLLRKLPEDRISDVLATIIASIDGYAADGKLMDIYCEGLAVMFFETVKGFKSGFHSKAPVFLTQLIGAAVQDNVSSHVKVVVEKVLILMALYSDAELLAPTVDIILASMFADGAVSSFAMRLITVVGTLRDGSKLIRDSSKFVPVVAKAWEAVKQAPFEVKDSFFDLFSVVFCRPSPQEYATASSIILDMCDTLELSHIVLFWKKLIDIRWPLFPFLVLPHLLAKVSNIDSEQDFKVLILFFSNCIHTAAINMDTPSSIITPDRRIRIGKCSFADMLFSTVAREDASAVMKCCAISILPHFAFPTQYKPMELLLSIVTGAVVSGSEDSLSVFARALEMYAILAERTGDTSSLGTLFVKVLEVLSQHSCSIFLLNSVATYIQILKAGGSKLLSEANLSLYYPVLKNNMNSGFDVVRKRTFEILSSFTQFPMVALEDTHEPCEILSLCLEIESTPNDVENARKKVALLKRMEMLYVTSKRMPRFYDEVIPRFACGLLTVNFQPLWKEAARMLAISVGRIDDIVWSIIWSQLAVFTAQSRIDAFYETPVPSEELLQLSALSARPVQRRQQTTGGLDMKQFHDHHLEVRDSLSDVNRQFFTADLEQNLRLFYVGVALGGFDYASHRFDRWNFLQLLMGCLSEHAPNLAETNAEKHLAPMLLNLALVYKARDDQSQEDSDLPLANLRKRLVCFMKLFAKFRKPLKSMFPETNSQLRQLYDSLLSKNDSEIQKLSLACTLSYRDEELRPYATLLTELLDEKTFRDRLTALQSNEDESLLTGSNRGYLMPYIVRILLGKMVKVSSNDTKGRLSSRRTASLSFMAGFKVSELRYFIDLILEPFAFIRRACPPLKDGEIFVLNEAVVIDENVTIRKQLGFLQHLEEICIQMGARLQPVLHDLLTVTLHLVRNAHRAIKGDEAHPQLAQLRQIRTLCSKRLLDLFSKNVGDSKFSFTPYMPVLFTHFLNDRVSLFAMENIQAPTSLMQLFLCWSSRPDYVAYLTDYNADVLPGVFACISSRNVKPSVVAMVLDVVENLFGLVDDSGASLPIGRKVIAQNVDSLFVALEAAFFTNFESLSSRDFAKSLLIRREIFVLSELSSIVTKPHQTSVLLEIFLPFLKKSEKLVFEQVKADIISIFRNAVSNLPSDLQTSAIDSYYPVLCHLFSSLQTRKTRDELVAAINDIAVLRPSDFTRVAKFVGDMNAYLSNKVDKVDWDRRLDAISAVISSGSDLSSKEWLALIHNLVFYVHNSEELAIRSNCSLALKSLVDVFVKEGGDELDSLIVHVIFPAVKKAMKSTSESIRYEFMDILAHLVKSLPTHPAFADMAELLGNGDEETSFFNTIYHVQMHRRMRSLRRFTAMLPGSPILQTNLVNIFLPVVTHFVFESDRQVQHQLVSDAIETLGAICAKLSWARYYALLRKYFKLLGRKAEMEKVLLRVIISIIDAFHWDLSEAAMVVDEEPQSDIEEDEELEDTADAVAAGAPTGAPTADSSRRIVDTVVASVLPHLFKLINVNEEGDSNLGTRIPLALSYCKLLLRLPAETIAVELPRLLTTISQILKSKNQQVRDTTREALAKIATLLGPKYFLFVLKEIKGALQKGYQLHILGYTVHYMLEKVASTFEVGQIDCCLSYLTPLLLEDIFGGVGEEKEVEEIVRQLKEAKMKKSFASFELLASRMSFDKIQVILAELKLCMIEKGSAAFQLNVEDILRKISHGLNSNPGLDVVSFVLFCFQLMTESGPLFDEDDFSSNKQEPSLMERNFKVRKFERLDVHLATRNRFADNAHLFYEFGFSLLQSALKHQRFDPKDPKHCELLAPTLVALEDSILAKNAKVACSSMKCLIMLNKFPIPAMEKCLGKSLESCLKVAKRLTSTGNELGQSCLKLLTLIIRDRSKTMLAEKQILFLINLVKPDLEIPEKQNNAFSLIKAIVLRKFVAPEVYDVMDDISNIMVTNQSSHVRELCRQTLFQFLLDYPVGKARLDAQIATLLHNLSYRYESGRESAIEFANSIIIRFPTAILDEYAELMFLSLVMRLGNEEASKCKALVGELVKVLSASVSTNKLSDLVRISVKLFADLKLRKVVAQAIGLVIEGASIDDDKCAWLKESQLEAILTDLIQAVEEFDTADTDWQIGYFCLLSIGKAVKVNSKLLARIPWETIQALVSFPHAWICASSSKLIGQLLQEIDTQTLNYKWGAESFLSGDIVKVRSLAYGFTLLLRAEQLTEDLGSQIVKNLFILARCLFANKSVTFEHGDGSDEEESSASEQERTADNFKWLIKKLSFVARGDQNANLLGRSMVYRCFAVIADFLSVEALEEYLYFMLAPIQRTLGNVMKGPEYDSLREFCQELVGMFEKKLGTAKYFTIQSRVEKRVHEIRDERRKQRKMLAITDPEAKAKRKISKNLMKKESRKRKIGAIMKTKQKFSVKKARIQ